MSYLLKFRYFFLFLLILSCNESSEKKAESKPENTTETPESTNNTSEKVILFFGDSLTAGYQLDTQEAFPALIQDRLDSIMGTKSENRCICSGVRSK